MDTRSILNDSWTLFSGSSVYQIVFCAFFVILLSQVALFLYRITFHPLARFPGPKLAGASYWHEYYYDVTKQGSYIWKIMELHKQYGPVIRVNPNELHVSDPEFYPEIYHNQKWRTDRDKWYNLEFLGQAVAFTTDHDHHAMRRQAVAPYFSMQSIRALEPRITAVVEHMIERLRGEYEAGSEVNLYHLFSAYAIDVVSEHAFGKEGSLDFMSNPDYGKWWADLTTGQVPINPFARQFKLIMKLMMAMPESLMVRMNSLLAPYIGWNNLMLEQVRRILNEDTAPTTTNKTNTTIFHELKNSSLPPSEKHELRLRDEASMVLGAGGETTARTLATMFYHILSTPEVVRKLREELDSVISDPNQTPTLITLQNLPYLGAVVEEGTRIAFPVPARSPRVFHDHALKYGKWTIKPGTAISMCPWMVTMSPKIFPEPFSFKPERWLDNKELLHYQVTFGKGRRACLGKNLAYAEMLYAVAMIVRTFDMELYETTYEDVKVKHDYFIALPRAESQGVRAKVVKVMD